MELEGNGEGRNVEGKEKREESERLRDIEKEEGRKKKGEGVKEEGERRREKRNELAQICRRRSGLGTV